MKILRNILITILIVLMLLLVTGCTAFSGTDKSVIKHTHTLSELRHVEGKNCQSYGYMEYGCNTCSYVMRIYDSERRGHVFFDYHSPDKPATPTSEGEKSRHCKWIDICGERTDIVTIPKTDPPDMSEGDLPESGGGSSTSPTTPDSDDNNNSTTTPPIDIPTRPV